MTNEEKNNILDQHKEIYDGYVTSYAQPEKNQPLYTQDYANDKEGVTVNNKGEVSSYKNMNINEMHADGKSTGLFSKEEPKEQGHISPGSQYEPEESFESEEDKGHYVSMGEQLDMIGDGDDDLEHGTFEDWEMADDDEYLRRKSGEGRYFDDEDDSFNDDDIMALTNPDDSDDDFDLNIIDLFGLDDDEFENEEQDDIISNITESLDMFKRFMKYN
jgi:hypothetical protein